MILKMNKLKNSKILKEKTIKMKKTTNFKMKNLVQIMKLLTKSRNSAPMKISTKILMDKATKMSKARK